MSTSEYIRRAALTHTALGTSRTKVIFTNENGDRVAYWMSPETYNCILLTDTAIPNDYAFFGDITRAKNTDIYSVEMDTYSAR